MNEIKTNHTFEVFQNKNFIERVLFKFLNFLILKIRGQHYLRNSILLFIFCLFSINVLITFYFCDPFLVWLVEDYEIPSIVYGYNNKGEIVPYAEFYSQNRKIIELTGKDFQSLNVVKTFIAAEDIRFKEHFGIDIPGIIRAIIINILAGEIKEGASTLTQQTARLRFLSRERNIIRKLREVSLSLLLELKYPKYKILEIYFNEVPLGHGTIGIEAASQFYFNKSFKDLSLGEASVLSSLTTSPNNYSPLKDPIKSISKMKITFKRLVESGEISINQAKEEYKNIIENYILTLNRYPEESSFTKRLDIFPYTSSYLLRLLPESIKNNLTTGGYKIYTTLNVDKQKIAEHSLEEWLKNLNKQKFSYSEDYNKFHIFDDHFSDIFPLLKNLFGIANFKVKYTKEERDFKYIYLKEISSDLILLNYIFGEKNIINAIEQNLVLQQKSKSFQTDFIEGALVSINPMNGKLEAIVGGSKFIPSNQLLRFLSKRQPGSSLKPFLYAAGIDHFARNPEDQEHGITAATLLEDNPLLFIDEDLSEYNPENYGGNYLGFIRVRDALVYSINNAAVQAYIKIGPNIVNSYLEKVLNLPENTLPKEASIALGSNEVTPLQLATAFTVFPRNGSIIEPYFIEKITKIEKEKEITIYQAEPPKIKNIYLPQTMFIIKDILREVVTRGTGKLANISGVPIFGKTGTTNRHTNAWFSGFTPDNVTVVYIGYDNNKPLGQGSGGSLAAPLWRNYMYNVLKELNFPKYQKEKIPDGIIQKNICSSTGKLPTPDCNSQNEYFIEGTEPQTICDIHSKEFNKTEKKIEVPLKLKIQLE